MGQGSVRLHAHHLRAHARLRLRIVQNHHLALGIALTILFLLLLLLLGLDGHLLLIRLAKILAVIPLVQLKFLFPWLLLFVSSLAAIYVS